MRIYFFILNFLFFSSLIHATPIQIQENVNSAFEYFLNEVDLDATITHEEQHEKIDEFITYASLLSPESALRLTDLLLEETQVRMIEMFHQAGLDDGEIQSYLSDYEKTIVSPNMSVEMARQMLFFVAELKIHRQYIYEFGTALGCPGEQLLHHDLCKLSFEQFEGYARYFRGGRKEEDKAAYLAAWGIHQQEEHHHESYKKEGFNFDDFSEESLRNNMLESVADYLAATKQRGGGSLIDRLIHVFPKNAPHPRLIPYLREGFMKAHALYLEAEADSDPNSLFKGLPCWNDEVEAVFLRLETN